MRFSPVSQAFETLWVGGVDGTWFPSLAKDLHLLDSMTEVGDWVRMGRDWMHGLIGVVNEDTMLRSRVQLFQKAIFYFVAFELGKTTKVRNCQRGRTWFES